MPGYMTRERAALERDLSAIVTAVSAAAPVRHLIRKSPKGDGSATEWEPILGVTAGDVLHAFWEQLPETREKWDLAPASRRAVECNATKWASVLRGKNFAVLRNELMAVATVAVHDAASSYNPARGSRAAFDTAIAANAMRAYLDPKRSRDFYAIWWPIENAIETFRNKWGQPPEIDDIVEALDPAWARKQKPYPRFSRAMVAGFMSLHANREDAAFSRATSPETESLLQDLIRLAKLTEQQKAVLRERMDGRAHKEIAEKLGITERRSIRLVWSTTGGWRMEMQTEPFLKMLGCHIGLVKVIFGAQQWST